MTLKRGVPYIRTWQIFIIVILSLSFYANAQDDGLRVIYTGKLFGYYRIEPAQNLAETPDAVQKLLNALRSDNATGTKPEAIILGMGDNFAPEMGAALQLQNEHDSECEDPPDATKSPPESFYKDETRIAKLAKCDNVANFLIKAHYRAIVPGREDFLYGATWLRGMSNLLKELNGSTTAANNKIVDNGSLSLLAANLRLSFAKPGVDLQIPSGADNPPGPCPLFFSRRQNLAFSTCADELTPSALDWLNRFDTLIQPGTGVAKFIENSLKERNNDKDKNKNEDKDKNKNTNKSITPARVLHNERAAMFSMLPPDQDFDIVRAALASKQFDSSNSSDTKAALNALKREWRYVASQREVLNKRKPWLDHLTAYVEAVIEAHESGNVLINTTTLREGREALLYAIDEEQRDTGYSVLATATGKHLLIIGVVGEATMNATQPANSALCVNVQKHRWSDLSAGSSLEVPYLTDEAISFTADNKCPHRDQRQAFQTTVKVFDPVRSIEAILRATQETNEANFFQYRIIMAQMPHTAAEELASRLQQDATKLPQGSLPLPDIVLSEAQIDHVSPSLTLTYTPPDSIPVLTPSPAYIPAMTDREGNPMKGHLVRPESQLLIHSNGSKRTVENARSKKGTPWAEPGINTLTLLNKALPKNNVIGCVGDPPPEPCKLDAIRFLLQLMQKSELSDMAILPRRDFFLDALPKGYEKWEYICGKSSPNTKKKGCQLQVALDRILWKGDHAERIMVSGKDLQELLDKASNLSSQEQALVPNDLRQEWVSTFGLVTNSPTNLTRLAKRSDTFYVSQEPTCKDIAEQERLAATNSTMYCVNGAPIVSDRAYALVTSDSFAEDKAIFGTLSVLPEGYHDRPAKAYLTHMFTSTVESDKDPETRQILSANEQIHQQRRLLTVDIAKVVVGYNASLPSGGDQNVASNFQGASDSRAASPHKAELDLEAKTRIASHGRHVTVGIQSDLEYDRSVQGNLAGTPVNGVYQPNSLMAGGFVQFPLGRPPILHTVSLVIAPYQYQRQIVGTYLYFPFTNSPTSQLIVKPPAANGFSNRAGLRWDVRSTGKSYLGDVGSYFEVGAQYGWQNNVISQLDLATAGSSTLSCPASSGTSIGTCTKKYPIDATTRATLDLETLHQYGLYWDIHYQRALMKDRKEASMVSLVIDSQGDYFAPRSPGKTLSTQTYYDDLLKIGFAFPVFRNLAFAPTYSPFVYGNQITQHNLVVNTFSLTARWYFDREAGVRFRRQLVFVGPASADQTTSGKTK